MHAYYLLKNNFSSPSFNYIIFSNFLSIKYNIRIKHLMEIHIYQFNYTYYASITNFYNTTGVSKKITRRRFVEKIHEFSLRRGRGFLMKILQKQMLAPGEYFA